MTATLGIIGGGAWGTALALAARRAGLDPVLLWCRRAEQVLAIREQGENADHLPGIALDPGIVATAAADELATAETIILAVPAQALRAVLGDFSDQLSQSATVVIAAKGIERGTGFRLDQVVAELMPGRPVALLSGPSFAAEVAQGLPTAVTIAAADLALADHLTRMLGSRTFRPYASDDPIGVGLGGAAKNVLAIACGIAVGRKLGDNARAALITRGLAEMTRAGIALGGRAETFAGLSGLGDLVLTCAGAQSRNLRFGIALGEGQDIAAARTAIGTVEGADTAASLTALARAHSIDMPIVAAVDAVLSGALTIDQALDGLLARPFRGEGSDEIECVRLRLDQP